MKNILLFGGSGQLGSHILRDWSGIDVTAPSSADINVSDGTPVRALIAGSRWDAVINCSAFNKVDECESDPKTAFEVNALAVNIMAEACGKAQLPFVTFSSDYVFEGNLGRPYSERDCPRPISAYGASKLAGELLARRAGGAVWVVRTCAVYGLRVSASKGYTFIDRIIRKARAGEHLSVVNDQTVSPTYTGHLTRGLKDLLERGQPGVYHMVNEGAVTWYDFALEALQQAGVNADVRAVSSAEFGAAARRPQFSALENAGLHGLGITLPNWREGIAAYLKDKAAAERSPIL